MGHAERSNPNSLRNLNPDERGEALARKEAAREERQAKKVYVNPTNYLYAIAMSAFRARQKKQEQRKAAEVASK